MGISLCDGKYFFYKVADGTLKAKRNGESWRDFTGDKAVSALYDYCEDLQTGILGLGSGIERPKEY